MYFTQLKLSSRWTVIFLYLLAMGLMWATATGPNSRELASTVFIATIAVYINVFFHELGHTIAGHLVRFTFNAFTVGPLALVNTGQGIQFQLIDVPGALGFSLFSPPDRVDLRRRMLWWIAGGPIATVIVCLLGAFLSFVVLRPIDYRVNAMLWTLRTVALWTTGIAAVLAYLNIYPAQWIFNDGSQIAKLLSRGSESDRWIAVKLVSQDALMGKAPREWEPELIAQMTAKSDLSTAAITANYLAYRYALDRDDLPQAHAYLSAMLKSRHKTSAANRAVVLAEAAYFEAFYRNDLERAKNWHSQIKRRFRTIPQINRQRTDAAMKLADNNPQEAKKIALKAQEQLSKAKDGISLGECKLFNQILDRITQQEMEQSPVDMLSVEANGTDANLE